VHFHQRVLLTHAPQGKKCFIRSQTVPLIEWPYRQNMLVYRNWGGNSDQGHEAHDELTISILVLRCLETCDHKVSIAHVRLGACGLRGFGFF
jgi:hypothetical protein